MFVTWYLTKIYIVIGVVLACAVIVFFLWLYVTVKYELKKNSADMYECKTHGFFPMTDLLYYDFPQEDGHSIKVPSCPMCMRDNFNKGVGMIPKANKVIEFRKDKRA